MNYSIEDIEAKIIVALAPLSKDRGGDVNTLDRYKGEFSSRSLKEEDSLLICPAILIRYIESAYDPDGGASHERTLRFALYHASSNLRPEKRKSDVYSLLDRSKALLNFNDLGLSIAPLTIETEKMVDSPMNVAVYTAQYFTSFQEAIAN